MTASHAVVIKRSLEVVGGSALNLSYYSNLLSALVLMPLIVLAGEGPEVMKLLVGEGDGFKTIFWGSTITVRLFVFLVALHRLMLGWDNSSCVYIRCREVSDS